MVSGMSDIINKKNTAVIWGGGTIAHDFLLKKIMYSDYEIKAVVDNDSSKWGRTLCSFPIVSPHDLSVIKPDYIIICSRFYNEIKTQIENEEYYFNKVQILTPMDLENAMVKRICSKYSMTKNAEINRILRHYEKNGFNIFGDYMNKPGLRYKVFRDNDGMPYIFFDDKRMYFRRDYAFYVDSTGEYVLDIMYEQQTHSPHLYVREGWNNPSGIVVDAGVCEGNFALKYIDNIEKAYLIEADRAWAEALERTFSPYKEKTVICNKYLSDKNDERCVSLDYLIKDQIDFLKMDIEGAEVEALNGAKEVLERSQAKCSICSYHRFDDETKIRAILEKYGYSTTTSDGYMFFVYDDDICKTMDFRRGIVYGEKNR